MTSAGRLKAVIVKSRMVQTLPMYPCHSYNSVPFLHKSSHASPFRLDLSFPLPLSNNPTSLNRTRRLLPLLLGPPHEKLVREKRSEGSL
jgi:hypothetical protein